MSDSHAGACNTTDPVRGFSHLLGLRRALDRNKKLACINLDAHLDVRRPNPEITSGSPFYLAITEQVIEGPSLAEFGIQSHCNGPELWEFANTHRVPITPFSDIRGGRAVAAFKKIVEYLAKTHDLIAISLDLDSFAEAYAPGVSAPQSEGFTPTEVIEMLEWAGSVPQVTSLGIFELNPLHDRDEKTARLAATCAYHFAESRIRHS